MKHKSCPFCGCNNIELEEVGLALWWRAVCINCSARSQMAGKKGKAWINWNERSNSDVE